MTRILCSRRLCYLLAISLLGVAAQAQKSPAQLNEAKQRVLADPRVKSAEVSPQRGTPSFIVLNERTTSFTPSQSLSALNTYLGLRSGTDNLILNRSIALRDQVEVQEFHQYFKGLKVEHSRYTSFVKNGRVRFFNGAFFDVPQSLSTQARLTEAQALGYAKAVVNAKVYAWEALQDAVSKATNAAQKAALQEELNEYLPKGELVIVRNFNNESVAEMHLAYKFNIYSFEPISRQWIYVDANDGQILLVDKIIKHVDDEKKSGPLPASVSTTVRTRYAGNRSINTKQISGTDPNNGQTLVASNPTELYTPGAPTYSLIDDLTGGGIETYDLNGVGGLPVSIAAAYSQAKAFTDVDNNWTLAEHQRGSTVSTAPVEAENDDIAWDAHWGATVVYDYWKNKHSRLSFDGKNAKIKSYIHSGLGYDNAFWNGKVMTYGDGSYPAKSNGFKPLTSLDVCGHEIGHGICSFTSDLVYAKESGAMNEALSDIWAACIEYYALQNIDGTLPYKPFYIGEQISANPALPLRRMDNPQARTDPDTYGGTYWTVQDGCAPTLANDQCGVHNNSGVLNKWFYLITVGSGAGSGPDVAYAGQDDGVNDKGNAYSVTGLGFSETEKIVYMMETLLTSNATFAEAREVSIQVATDLSGSGCSNVVKQVTNAWYAVGVGAAFTEPCKINYGFITQPGSSVSEGQAGSGCNAEYEVRIPVLMPANSTASVSVSGTATGNVDYRLGSTALSNTGTTAKAVYLSVFVINDGVIENDETVNLTITNMSNVGTNTLNSTYRLNIVEDDVTPVIGTTSKSLLNANFDSEPTGFASPGNWTEIVAAEGTGPTGENYNQWGVWSGKLMITGKLDKTGPEMVAGTYNDNSPSSTVLKSPQVDGRGLNNITVDFDFRVQGEIDPSGADIEAWGKFDYMEVMYSLDGSTFYPLTIDQGFGQFASAAVTEGHFRGVLPSFLNNKMFYLGFKWYNDTNAGGPESVQVDNVSVTGSPRQIENDLDHNSNEKLLAGQNVYFYSVQDGQILGSINNTSAKSFGCTGLSISRAGDGTAVLDLGTTKPVVSQKAVKVTTETSNKVTTLVTLYYTEAQIKALETASQTTRSNFAVYQVNAALLSGASSNNTTKLTATYTPIEGVGGYFTVSVGNKLGGSHYVLGYAPGGSVRGGGRETLLVAEEASMQPTEFRISAVYPNPTSSNAFVNITSPESMKLKIEYVNVAGQLVQVQQQQVNPGLNRVQLNVQPMSTGTFMVRFTDEKGNKLDAKQFVKQK